MDEDGVVGERPTTNAIPADTGGTPVRPRPPEVRPEWRGWRTLLALGVLLVIAAAAALVYTPLRSWGQYLTPESALNSQIWGVPSPPAIAAMLLAGPVLSVAVGLLVIRRRLVALAGVAGAVVVGLAAWRQLAKPEGAPPQGASLTAWNLPPYGPVTVVAAVALAVGWLLVLLVALVGARRRERMAPAWGGWSAVALGTVLALFVAGGVVTARWYGTHRGVDRTTAQPLAARPAGPPRDLDRVAWRATEPGRVRVAGRYVVAAEQDGVSVRDAATGRELWHYRRHMLPSTPPVIDVDADQRTVVTMWPGFDPAAVLAGFDVATGKLLWSSAQQGDEFTLPVGPLSRFTQIGNTVIVARDEGPVVGIDVRTGVQRWHWLPQAGCEPLQFVPTAEVLAVAVDCSPDPAPGGQRTLPDGSTVPADTKVIGISGADGTQRWTFTPPSPVASIDRLVGAEPAMGVAGDGLRVATTGHGDVTLDPATGVERHPAATRKPSPSANTIFTVLRGQQATVYLGDEHSRGNAVAIDDSGAIRWARDIPALDDGYVSSSAVSGNIGYALTIPATSGRDPNAFVTFNDVIRRRRLVAIDLTTGAVLADQEIVFDDDCACTGLVYPPTVSLMPSDGGLLMSYASGRQGVRVIAYN
jgi:outer membrane protein assembly factor BamB